MDLNTHLPSEPKPKITIQDSYLKYYFIGFSQNKQMHTENSFLHKKKIREDSLSQSIDAEIKNTNTNIDINIEENKNKNISCTIVKSAEIYTNKFENKIDNKEDDLVPLVIRNKNKKQ
jgi:hypothetical protein